MRQNGNEIALSDDERAVLESVRERLGMETIDQVAEMLAKRGLRASMLRLTGRSRALYVVQSSAKSAAELEGKTR
jgi:hypothetical protein